MKPRRLRHSPGPTGPAGRVAVVAAMVAAVVSSAAATIALGGCANPWHNESAELEAQDSAAALRIQAALIEDLNLAGAAIDVEFSDGRARLTGFVETREQRRAAARVAREQQGVTGVVNEIVVK